MSGFLANLLSRSRGTADVVRPRLASLFEPGEPRAAHLDGQPVAEQDGDEVSAADGHAATSSFMASPQQDSRTSSAARSHRVPPRDAREREFVTLDETHGDAQTRLASPWQLDPQDTSSDRRAVARERTATPLAGEGPADDADGARSDPAAALARGEEGQPPPSAVAGAGDHVNGDSRLRSVPSARVARAAAAVAPGARHARRGSRSGGLDATNAHLGAHPPAAAAPSSTLNPAPALASRFRFEPPPSRPRADAGEPTIDISIGRIEIRAAVDPGSGRTAASASSSSPVMGLDEYLKTHARGGPR